MTESEVIEKEEPSKKKKSLLSKILITFGVLVIVLVLALVGGYFYLFGSDTTDTAKLEFENGEVMVNGEIASSPVFLGEGDRISTQTSNATLVLYESVYMYLSEGSDVTLTSLDPINPVVEQSTGKVEVNFAHTTSVERFNITNNGTTYSVNGTYYSLDFSSDMIRSFVLNGAIFVAFDGTWFVMNDLNMLYTIERSTLYYEVRRFNEEETKLVLDKAILARDNLVAERQELIDEYPELVKVAQKASGKSEEDMYTYLENLDNGTRDELDSIVEKFPFTNSVIEKGVGLTEEIQKFNEYINKYS